MFKKRKNRTAYAVIGLGRFGQSMVNELSGTGADIVAVDRDEAMVTQARGLTEHAYIAPVLDEKSLLEIGVQHCDVAIVCVDNQIDLSILVTLAAVNMGIPKVIAKADSSMHGKILKKLGAEVVYPEWDMAIRVANRLRNSNVLDVVHLSEQINISKVVAPKFVVGRTVMNVNLRERFHLNIIAIEHGGQAINDVQPGYIFAAGDILYLSGSTDGLAELSKQE